MRTTVTIDDELLVARGQQRGATWVTTDRGFARVPGLSRRPLVTGVS